LAKSLQTGTQSIKIKSSVKSEVKNVAKFFSGSMGSGSKLGLRIFGLSNSS
jgi:hypothetical protein